jgi:hypothetical protein
MACTVFPVSGGVDGVTSSSCCLQENTVIAILANKNDFSFINGRGID